MKKSKKLFSLFIFLLTVLLTSCSGGELTVDYTDAESFEKALNNGENLEGKVVQFVADDLKPDSSFGYDIWAGEHLNFVSSRNPDVKKGDIVTVRTTTIESVAGSWIINYEKLNSESSSNSNDLTSTTNEPQQGSTNSDDFNNENANEFGTIANNFASTTSIKTEPAEEAEISELPLEIVEYDFYGSKSSFDDVINVNYYALVHNPNELIALFPKVYVTITANDGSILGTNNAMGSIIMPDDTGFIFGQMSVPSADLTSDSRIHFEADYDSLTDYTSYTPFRSTDLEISNIKERSSQYESFITGTITNNYTEEIDSLEIVAVLKKDGKTVYTKNTYVSGLKAGKQKAFQIDSYSDLPEHDTIEVYAAT